MDSVKSMSEKIAMAMIENPLAAESMVFNEQFEDETEELDGETV